MRTGELIANLSIDTQPTFQIDFCKLLHPEATGGWFTHFWEETCPWGYGSTGKGVGGSIDPVQLITPPPTLSCQKPGKYHCAQWAYKTKSSWEHTDPFIVPTCGHGQYNPISIMVRPGRKPKVITEKPLGPGE